MQPRRKTKRGRILLQLDFGGPIVNDALIERTRMRTALRAARESGLLAKISQNANRAKPGLSSDINSISRKEFIEAYNRGKSHLKKLSKKAEAYDDVNRTAAALLEAVKSKWGIVRGVTYADLTKGIDKKTKMAFFKKFSGPIRVATEKSVNKQAFATIAKILQNAKTQGRKIRVDIVTDNNPVLYRIAFQKAINAKAKAFAAESKQKVIKARYRKNPKTPAGKRVRATTLLLSPAGKSRAYISGEGWGNKKNPETWKRILKDRKVKRGEKVVFVDDSLKKLEGFYKGTEAFGAVPVAVWLDLKKENITNLTGTGTKSGFPHFTIQDIGQLEMIIEKER